MVIDESKLNALVGEFVQDRGAVTRAATIAVGDQSGLCKALADRSQTPFNLIFEARP